jgi:hypothetical protein
LAARFKARFRISLADAFTAPLAKERKAKLVKGAPEFRALEKELLKLIGSCFLRKLSQLTP